MADRVIISSFSLRYSNSGPSVLDSISLEIPGGSCCAIIGPTGAGKSSLLHCLAGTMKRHHPQALASGRVQIGDMQYEGLAPQILFPSVGLVLQDPFVQISGVRDTVYDEVLFTLENMGEITGSRLDDHDRMIFPLLRDLGIEHLAQRKPTTLSGGETQRLALATTLVARPAVLLLDEPSTALDMSAQEKLRGILKGMKGKSTIVLTDTQLDLGLGLCDQFIVLDHGRVTFKGTPGDLLSRLHEFSSSIVTEGWIEMDSRLRQLRSGGSPHAAQIARVLGIS